MELREYLKVIQKYRTTFFGFWFGVIFLGLFIVFVQPKVYQGEFGVTILRQVDQANKQGDKNNYFSGEYDYFYQLEANKSLSKMLTEIVKDKSFMKEVLLSDSKKTVLIPEENWIISKIEGTVLGAGYINFTIKSHQGQLIEPVKNKLVKAFRYKLKELSVPGNQLSISSQGIVIRLLPKPYFLVGLGTFFGGGLVSFFLVMIIFYFSKNDGNISKSAEKGKNITNR